MEQLPSFNWIDLLILAILLFYAFEGYAMGLLRGVIDFFGFIVSFLIALNFYHIAGDFLVKNFALTKGMANAAGFFLTAFIAEMIFAFTLSATTRPFLKALGNTKRLAKANRILGVLPGLATALVLISFFLSLVLTLPLSPQLKAAVSHSRIGSYLVVQSLGLEKHLDNVFGKAASEALNFFTIKPQSNERIDLNFNVYDGTVDAQSETEMLQLVNEERKSRGLRPLTMDSKLRELARDYARDMFERGYFSHNSPEGLTPFDRMVQRDITFRSAGENLALAPNVELAHKGLMESTGHRENILSKDFGRVGIGVIDGGIYGKMFVQEFTD